MVGPGRLSIMEGTMNSSLYRKIVKKNIQWLVCAHVSEARGHLGIASLPLNGSKKKKKLKRRGRVWSGPVRPRLQSNWCFHMALKLLKLNWKPSCVAELKQFCKEGSAKIPAQWCERLTASFQKHLIAVLAAKQGKTCF